MRTNKQLELSDIINHFKGVSVISSHGYIRDYNFSDVFQKGDRFVFLKGNAEVEVYSPTHGYAEIVKYKGKPKPKGYRVGRKQGLALLDGNGLEVALFRKGYEVQAQAVCDLLNGVSVGVGIPKMSDNEMMVQTLNATLHLSRSTPYAEAYSAGYLTGLKFNN
jgi:hypothetical protein